MDTLTSAARRRGWLSLATDRWHSSSRAVTALSLLVLIFCNVPGQSVNRVWHETGYSFDVRSQSEHGWPFTYLIRKIEVAPEEYDLPRKSVRDCFEVWRNWEEFHPWALLANCSALLLASVGTAVAFEAWRRRRHRIWHPHLSDLCVTMLVVCLAAAWYVREQRRYAMEDALFPVAYLDKQWPTLTRQADQEGGITWLRVCLGDELFQFLDRPFAVALDDANGWPQLETLTSAKLVSVCTRSTTGELKRLVKLPHLEALALEEDLDTPPDNVVSELPPLPKLRRLYISQPAHRCRRLDRLTSLSSLCIAESSGIDKQVLKEISVLPNLHELSLSGLWKSADLSFLTTQSGLSRLDIYDCGVSAASLKSIGQCRRLKTLSLCRCRIDGSDMHHLAGLHNLEALDLQYTKITDKDLAPLANLKGLRELYLAGTKVGGDLGFTSELENLETLWLFDTNVHGADLAPLVRLKHLRSLDLGGMSIGANGAAYLRQMNQLKWLRASNISEDELKALQRALPKCQVGSTEFDGLGEW